MLSPNEFAILETQRNAGLSVKNAFSPRVFQAPKAHQASPVQLVKLAPQVLQASLVAKDHQVEMASADQRVNEAHPVSDKVSLASTVVMVFRVLQAVLALTVFGDDKVATVP